MYAMVGQLIAQAGRRSEFAELLIRAASVVAQLPGCRMYLVHEDLSDENTLWVYEAWEDQESHAASLKDEQVRMLIAEAMPLMDGSPQGSALTLLGGHGLQ